MTATNIVHFGRKTFCITAARWDCKRHVGIVSFEDDNGIQYQTEALGLLPSEQRQAVSDAVKNAWIDVQAQDIGNTATALNTALRQLAIACGNHPYENGE